MERTYAVDDFGGIAERIRALRGEAVDVPQFVGTPTGPTPPGHTTAGLPAGYYVLRNRIPEKCSDAIEWLNEYEKTRQVNFTKVDKCYVSTVFLGVDYGNGIGEPLLFKTSIYGAKSFVCHQHTSTWEEAKAAHLRAIDIVLEERLR
jgi:hypothetical protein